MLQICCWYNKGHDDQDKVENIVIRYSNFGKQTCLYMKSINTNYKDIITSLVLNTVLHHVSISFKIEKNKHLEYDMDKHNPDWITGVPWYNTYYCKKLHGKVFEAFNIKAITDRYNLMCSIDAHEKSIRT